MTSLQLAGARPSRRTILRRRQNLAADIEAALSLVSIAGIGYATAHYFHGGFTDSDSALVLVLLIAMVFVYTAIGVHRKHGGFWYKTYLIAKAWSVTFGIVTLIAFAGNMLTNYEPSHVATFFVAGLASQVLLSVLMERAQRTVLAGRVNQNTLMIGTGRLADFLADRINSNPWVHETVVGAVSTFTGRERRAKDREMKLPLLGPVEDIARIIDERRIRTVYILTSMESSPELRKLYVNLLDRSININWVPDIFTLNLINHNVKELGGVPVIAMSETPLRGRMLVLKAIEDRLLAGLALLGLSPLIIAAALAVKLNSSGPILFKQERTGWDGRVFKIFKFRSMYHHPIAASVVKQATKDDPRVTPVGRFIRRTSIDELPQLINVLIGDMSLVGPRPHAVQHNDYYSRKIDAYLARHRIKPGITGLAQVRGFRGETDDIDLMEERVTSDIEYINNWSLWLDMVVLARTAFTLLNDRAY